MKIVFHAKWLQNIIIVLIAGAVLVIALYQKEAISEVLAPISSFWFFLSSVVLLTLLLLLITMISRRAEAIASARTTSLLETQKLFVELYRNSPVPYVLVDHKGRVTQPNHAATRLFGLEEETFAGINIFDLISVEDDEDEMKVSMIFSRFSQGVFVGGKDVLITRADGAVRYGLLSIFPYGNFGAKKKGLMTIVDITKQKEIEKAKSEFVSLASHQLRTPVSSMKWNLELMHTPKFGTFTPEQEEYFKKIVTGLGRMNSLIDDFLSVSQLELKTRQLNFTDVQLAAFCDEVCEEFLGRIEEKNLAISRQYDERVSSIETDKALLHMVVSNLVSNATKYTPEGGTVSVQYVGGAETVTILVSDTGVGIPAADQEKLFTKFFRAGNVREKVTGGTGLGLYIVKLAVEQLGGTISLESMEGQGTTFSVVLPYSSRGRVR